MLKSLGEWGFSVLSKEGREAAVCWRREVKESDSEGSSEDTRDC